MRLFLTYVDGSNLEMDVHRVATYTVPDGNPPELIIYPLPVDTGPMPPTHVELARVAYFAVNDETSR